MISVDMVDAVKVQFLKPIVEDDFVEKGMKAWITDAEWDHKYQCYKLYFDFTDFESDNQKYFKESFYSNSATRVKGLPEKPLYTAIEADMYSAKYSVYFGVSTDQRDDELFEIEIQNYLRIVE
jgi:hypothetical protein